MMKLSDVQAATALIIQGYLRSTEGSVDPESWSLQECIGAIQGECEDWAEGIKDKTAVDNTAVEPEKINIDLNVPRTPYNLRSAMRALGAELAYLDGIESISQFGHIDPLTGEVVTE